MKNSILLIIIPLILGCCSNQTNDLSGIWDATSFLRYPSDTISLETDFDPNTNRTTIKTDSGIMVISHVEDSIISILPTTKKSVLHFHFDNNSRGILSIYEIDSEQTPSSEDPRYTANNYNFSILVRDKRTYMVIDYHFHQYGRALDTLEFDLISSNQLILKGDTLKRVMNLE